MIGSCRHSDTADGQVVAFDFDGTLTYRDSFIAFLIWREGLARFGAGLLGLAPAVAGYGLNRDRGALKAATANRFLGGLTRAEIESDAQRFCDERFDRLMRPDALGCWREWAANGARLFIVTASPVSLVAPFARALGAEGLIGTRLAFDDDRFTGALDGPNCRGVEKVVRMRQALGSNLKVTAAYGDTAGDREMLAMAERPGLRVFTKRP